MIVLLLCYLINQHLLVNCFFAGTASASDINITTNPFTITFLVGDGAAGNAAGNAVTRCTSPFDVVDDDEQEPTESFTVFIISPPECLGNPSFETVNILDNDNGMLPYVFYYSRNEASSLPAVP